MKNNFCFAASSSAVAAVVAVDVVVVVVDAALDRLISSATQHLL